jgi:hypothetical protein
MTNSQKIALSLLLTILLTTGFAFFAYSGFFSFIEARYYNTRVSETVTEDLDFKNRSVSSYHAANFDRFRQLLSGFDPGAVYAPNWDQETIFSIRNLIEAFQDTYRGVVGLRFIDDQGKIHFSTFPEDSERAGQYKTIYRNMPEYEGQLFDLSVDDEDSLVFLADTGQFVYSISALDAGGRKRGTTLWYVSRRDFERALSRSGALDPAEDLQIVDGGFLFGSYGGIGEDFSWPEENGSRREVWSNGDGNSFYLFTADSGTVPSGYGKVGMFVDTDEFALDSSLKIILIIATFFSLFLILFLILNLRQDKVLVLSDRVRRFQIQFLREYLERKDELDWDRWHRDVISRKDEVKKGIKAGLGSLKPTDEEEVDRLIESGWEEIFSVIDRRIADRSPALPAGQVDIRNLEEVVGKILALGQSEAGAAGGGAAVSGQPGLVQTPAAPAGTSDKVEELRETAGIAEPVEPESTVQAGEELEELEELEEMEPAEAEEVVEAAEEAEEAGEELEELEELEEMEPAEAEEVVEAAEEAAEAEEQLEEKGGVFDFLTGVEGLTELVGAEPSEESRKGDFFEEPEVPVVEQRVIEQDAKSTWVEHQMQLLQKELKKLSGFGDLEKLVARKELEERLDRLIFSEKSDDVSDQETLSKEDVLEFLEIVARDDSDALELEYVSGEPLPFSRSFMNSGMFSYRPVQGFLEMVKDVAGDEREIIMAGRSDKKTSQDEEFEDVEEIEELDSLEESGDAEEPEELEELEADEEPTDVSGIEDFEKLKAANRLRMYPLSSLLHSETSSVEAIALEDGVFQVSDSVVRGGQTSRKKEFKELVEEVLSEDDQKADLASGNLGGGIDSLLGMDADIPDFADILGDGDSTEMSVSSSSPADKSSLFDETSFLFDTFLSRFKSGTIGLMKSLMKISQKLGAMYAAILTEQDDAWSIDYSIGFNRKSMETFKFGNDEPIVAEVFKARLFATVFLGERPVSYFHMKMCEDDRKYSKGMVFIPIIYEGKESYLFVSLRRPEPRIETLVEKLNHL